MIDFYFFPTPNTWKVGTMLEECGLRYRILPVDITRDEQFSPEFLSLSPNNKVPAIVDRDTPWGAKSVFESGAILIYLAEKTGRFLPHEGPHRVEVLEWLFWQMGGLGPMAGQAHHFLRYAPEGNDYAMERYTKECARLYGVLDRRLNSRDWIAGDYSIADIACWGWVWFHPLHAQSLDDFPNIARWFETMSKRPAVKEAKKTGLDTVSDEMRSLLEGPAYGKDPRWAATQTRVR